MDEVLEVGPGPGLTTDWLRRQCKSITCIEVDPELAASLDQHAATTNVSVRCGDATAMPYGTRAFSGAVAFTMLHHLRSCRIDCLRRSTGFLGRVALSPGTTSERRPSTRSTTLAMQMPFIKAFLSKPQKQKNKREIEPTPLFDDGK